MMIAVVEALDSIKGFSGILEAVAERGLEIDEQKIKNWLDFMLKRAR